MFSKRDRGGEFGSPADKDLIKAFLGEETEFNGLLTFSGMVRIDGRFEGKIESPDNLVIGSSGDVTADVTIGSIMVQGRLVGNIHASGRAHISSAGEVIGDIHAASLCVEEGARIEGKIAKFQPEAESGDVAQNLSAEEESEREESEF